MKFEVQNLTELKKVAEEILSVFPSHKLFLLCGEMGAGKTTLTKEFCKILQCEGYGSSPTFSIVNEYHSPLHKKIYHFDCYRLTDPEELEYIGIREYLKPRCLQLIEWPELGKGVLAKSDISIELSGNGDIRNAKITFQTDLGQSIKECAIG